MAFVTDRARNAERDIIAGMRAGLDAGRSLAPAAAVEARLEGAGLNPGQRDAARAILLSPHRTVGVQGHAGSGKTTMLRTVKELAGENRIVGLAPSASAVHVLAGEADIPARTLQRFLTRYRNVGDGIAPPEKTEEARKALGGAVLILDEASMVGTVQMRALTRIAAQTEVARLALIGDRRQLRSVEAGQPFGLLQDAGMPTARMDEVVRQRDSDLRQAVLHMVADEPRMAVEELGNGVLETESDELGRKAAQLWLDLDPSLRAGTAILAPTHELRAEINDAVRQGLEDEGVLHGPELEIERYVNLHLTRSQKGEGCELPAGRRRRLPSRRLRRQGQSRRRLSCSRDAGRRARASGAPRRQGAADRPGRLHPLPPRPLRDPAVGPEGRRRGALDPQRCCARPDQRRTGTRAVYRTGERQDRDPGRARNRHGARRPAASPSGSRILLDRARGPGPHLRPGDRRAGHGRGAPADQAMFYVELTRARDNVVLLTDDREALIEALETSPAEELSALRAIGEQFESPDPTVAQRPPPERAAVLDEASRERRREVQRFVEQALATAAASLRERNERAREAHSHDAHITLARGYADWREGARRALADCRKILDDPQTFGRHLHRRPGAAAEMQQMSAQIEADLKEDSAEIDRRQKLQEQQKRERQKQGQQERERRKAKTRDRGGLSM